MDHPAVFDELKVALQGTTVLVQPRVSRETIISVLQTHTDLLMSMRKDHRSLSAHVDEIEKETKDNKRHITALETEATEIKKDLESLFRQNEEFRREVEELSTKVAELYVVKKQMAEQQQFVDGLSTQFTTFAATTEAYLTDNTTRITSMQALCDRTSFQLKEMKEYVDHFADNLVLNSQQITVDTYAGFSSKPISLTEVLRMCNAQFVDNAATNSRQDTTLEKLAADLDTKAPDTLVFNVSTLEKKVSTIELHIQKEEEQGIGALRKICEQLSVQMQAVNAELADKIDRESVSFIVHEKYEEIVRYLHEALQSSLEDERNFKEKADEIQEMVILLSNSKADRTEIANMQEVMVKSEALLKKVGAQANLKDKIKDFVSRKEIEGMLALKVDKSDFDTQLQQAVVNSRRQRRISTQNTSLPPVTDAALAGNMGPGGGGSTYQHGTGSRPNSGGSPEASFYHHQNVPGAGGGSQFHSVSAGGVGGGAPGAGGGGAMGAAGGGVGGRGSPVHQPPQLMPIPVIALGQGLQPPSTGGMRSSADFSSYLKNKGQSGRGKELLSGTNPAAATPMVMSMSLASLPSGEVPGGFRRATEGLGSMKQQMKSTSTFQEGSTQGSGPGGDHLAYLQGPMVGGGFNAQSKHLQRATPSGHKVPGDDVEGRGMMVQGQDGHLYYQDVSQQG